MAITNAQQAKQLQQEGGPMRKIKGQDHMLAYITPNEADKLVKLGGQETMTPEGILAYPEFDNYTESSLAGTSSADSGMSRSEFEGGAYSGTGNAGDGVIQQYNKPKEKPPVIPKKKPKKTKDNFRESNRFITPTLAAVKFVGEGIKNSKLGRYLNTKQREDYLEKLKEEDNELYQSTVDDLSKLGYATRDVEIYGPKGKRDGPMAPGRDIETFTDLYEDQAKSILNTVTNSEDGGPGTLYDDYLDSRNTTTGGGGGGNEQQQTDPCLGPNPPAYCSVGSDDDTEEEVIPDRNLGGLAPRFAGSQFDFTGLADGGRAGAMDGGRMMMMNQEEDDPVGGIMDLETSRQMYGLGKLVKKITRGVKKIAKSPVGKAALLYAGGSYLSGMGAFGGLKGAGAFNSQALGIKNFFMGKPGLFKTAGDAVSRSGGFFDKIPGGKYGAGILGTSILSGLMTPKEEEENNDDYYASNTIDYNNVRNNPYKFLSAANQGSRFNVADGGIMRNGYAEGSEEPVAKKTMPLLDMEGQEMDLREEGGFVPLGRMERADDVPARLSKNEFVFTADAVRNAGEGDIDKGAEVMYNMMKNLESGGDVSEESQGLEGAREMFQTSQRLEEVI